MVNVWGGGAWGVEGKLCHQSRKKWGLWARLVNVVGWVGVVDVDQGGSIADHLKGVVCVRSHILTATPFLVGCSPESEDG